MTEFCDGMLGQGLKLQVTRARGEWESTLQGLTRPSRVQFRLENTAWMSRRDSAESGKVFENRLGWLAFVAVLIKRRNREIVLPGR